SYLNDFLPREKTDATALANDSINVRLKFRKEELSYREYAIKHSKERISQDADFNEILSVNQTIKKMYEEDKAPVALNFDGVFNDVHTMDAIWKSISTFEDKQQISHIKTPRDTYQRIMYDDFLVNTNEYREKLVKTNPYIKEGINILTDIYNLENK